MAALSFVKGAKLMSGKLFFNQNISSSPNKSKGDVLPSGGSYSS